MTDQQPTPSASDLRRQHEQQLHDALEGVGFDGPYQFPTGGDFLSAMFGGGPRSSFAVCLRCGAAVVLGDPEELADGTQVERGIRIHTGWHHELAEALR